MQNGLLPEIVLCDQLYQVVRYKFFQREIKNEIKHETDDECLKFSTFYVYLSTFFSVGCMTALLSVTDTKPNQPKPAMKEKNGFSPNIFAKVYM